MGCLGGLAWKTQPKYYYPKRSKAGSLRAACFPSGSAYDGMDKVTLFLRVLNPILQRSRFSPSGRKAGRVVWLLASGSGGQAALRNGLRSIW